MKKMSYRVAWSGLLLGLSLICVLPCFSLSVIEYSSVDGQARVVMDAGLETTLRPIIGMMMVEKSSRDLLECYKQLQRGRRYFEMATIEQIVEKVINYLDSKHELVEGINRGVSCDTGCVYAIVSALQWLHNLKDDLQAGEIEDQRVLNLLDILNSANTSIVRALIDEGIRQIVVGISTTLDAVDSKIDAISEDIQSNVDYIDSKIDVIDNELEIVDSKVDVLDSKIGEFDCTSVDTGYWSTVESIDESDLSVLGWLKSIMRELKGLS